MMVLALEPFLLPLNMCKAEGITPTIENTTHASVIDSLGKTLHRNSDIPKVFTDSMVMVCNEISR